MRWIRACLERLTRADEHQVAGMKLVVGLGNPGRQYEGTRHNVGFRVVDELARRWQIETRKRKFRSLAGGGAIRDERVLLVKPQTYMNRSGAAVQDALAFHKVAPTDLLVLVDDMALPLGRVRVRARGSAGGHNGLADIVRQLGGDAFARLRIGIGQVGGERMVGHVLGTFGPEEEQVVTRVIQRAADAAECWIAQGVESAMNEFNRPEAQDEPNLPSQE